MREVPVEEARRIAVCAQGLDGRTDGVLETVRQLGFLQLDPISSVAPPQHQGFRAPGAQHHPTQEIAAVTVGPHGK